MADLLALEEWLRYLDGEYLDRFIASGGAAVKFAIGYDGAVPDMIAERVIASARSRNYIVARVSAATTRLQLVDRLFFAIADQVPWDALSQDVLADLARHSDLQVPAALGPEGLASQLAVHNQMDEGYIRMTLERGISNEIFTDRQLTKDFRVAMTWLCKARLNGGDEAATISADITAWLRGQIGGVSQMRPYQIFTKVNRFNARHLLESLFTWVRRAGHPGTVVVIDLRAVTASRRVPDTNFYTKAGLLDAYELLRQFIDDTDDLSGTLLVVTGDEDLLATDDHSRGVGAYRALMNRVFDEVRDRRRVNPMGTLVRLGGGATV
jgi:hypothetical protein